MRPNCASLTCWGGMSLAYRHSLRATSIVYNLITERNWNDVDIGRCNETRCSSRHSPTRPIHYASNFLSLFIQRKIWDMTRLEAYALAKCKSEAYLKIWNFLSRLYNASMWSAATSHSSVERALLCLPSWNRLRETKAHFLNCLLLWFSQDKKYDLIEMWMILRNSYLCCYLRWNLVRRIQLELDLNDSCCHQNKLN